MCMARCFLPLIVLGCFAACGNARAQESDSERIRELTRNAANGDDEFGFRLRQRRRSCPGLC